MKRKFLLLAMYRAMECLYEEQDQPSDELTMFLDDLSPYNFLDRKATDPALQIEFDTSMDRQNIDVDVDEELAYYAVKNFLAEQYPNFVEWAKSDSQSAKSPSFVELFEKISLDEWKKLCEIIAEEERPNFFQNTSNPN